MFWGYIPPFVGNIPLWHGCDAVRWWGAMMPGVVERWWEGLVGCVGSTRDINTTKNYLQMFCFWLEFFDQQVPFPPKMHQTTPPHTWWTPPENEHVAWKGIISIRTSSSNRYFSGAMLVSRNAFFGGRPSPRPQTFRVFHRKLFKNNIDDSGAEGIAQLFQSCPGIEDGSEAEKWMMRDWWTVCWVLFGYVLEILYGCFRKWWYPQIIHFNRVFHYKPSILGYLYFWTHPYVVLCCVVVFFVEWELWGKKWPRTCHSETHHVSTFLENKRIVHVV